MSENGLGRLERVDLNDAWRYEDRDFTPWLAQEENLAILGEALGIDLELEAQEKSVGPFRADILCRDDSGGWVLIENQLEKTDHTHLGQLLTYASGLEAVTIIWIAKKFTEEHRSTLDWLNRITDAKFHFFGVEVELWRIDDSRRAPKFNIVSKPNDWSRSVVRAVRGELSDTQKMQLDYWTAFLQVLKKTNGPVSGDRDPKPSPWITYPVRRGDFHLATVISVQKKRIQSELYIKGKNAKFFFLLLREEKTVIEQELGYPLEWEGLPNGKDCRIAIYWHNADPKDQDDWPNQHKWLAEKLNDLHRVFYDRIQDLHPDDLPENFTES